MFSFLPIKKVVHKAYLTAGTLAMLAHYSACFEVKLELGLAGMVEAQVGYINGNANAEEITGKMKDTSGSSDGIASEKEAYRS